MRVNLPESQLVHKTSVAVHHMGWCRKKCVGVQYNSKFNRGHMTAGLQTDRGKQSPEPDIRRHALFESTTPATNSASLMPGAIVVRDTCKCGQHCYRSAEHQSSRGQQWQSGGHHDIHYTNSTTAAAGTHQSRAPHCMQHSAC